jgi:hypothetical protein
MMSAFLSAATQRALLNLLEVYCSWDLPFGPLEDSCLKAVARWQVMLVSQLHITLL